MRCCVLSLAISGVLFFHNAAVDAAAAVVQERKASVTASAGTRRPVVLMHGLMATAEAMSHAQAWIEADFPGIHVKNVETVPSKIDTLLVDINKQVWQGMHGWKLWRSTNSWLSCRLPLQS